MRKILPALLVCTVACTTHAFPFRIGRALEYRVFRQGEGGNSVVTLAPVEARADSLGTNWIVQVTDSALGTGKVRAATAILAVRNGTMAWTKSSCLVPWDLGDPRSNPVAPASPSGQPSLEWGGLALACAGASAQKVWAGTLAGGERYLRSDWASGVFSSSETLILPPLEGRWSDDSGWVVLADGHGQQVWVLARVGDGPRADPGGAFAGASWFQPAAGRRWLWRETSRWSVVDITQDRSDSATTEVEWTALERLGDSGAVGTWRFSRARGASEPETLDLDFDSPLIQAESRHPSDFGTTVLLRGSRPSWLDDPSPEREFSWTTQGTATPAQAWSDTTRRRYVYRRGCGVVRMEQTYRKSGQAPNVVRQVVDSTRTFELLSLDGVPLGGTTAVPLPASPRSVRGVRSLPDLDRFVEEGGRILSISDAHGRRAAAVDGIRGIVVVAALDPEGRTVGFRLVRP